MEKRFCKECEEPLVGRSDKKFCSDQCRNAYNNRMNSDVTKVMRNINYVLRRNRRILHELLPENKRKVQRSLLLQRGFDFSYFTHEYRTKRGEIYRFCYELGYLLIDHDQMLLVRRLADDELNRAIG
jgi:hypothetical protein